MLTKINKARNLGTIAHEGQVRKFSGLPYFVHPTEVHNCLCDWIAFNVDKLTDEQISQMRSAAYLHDVLEDCPQITNEQIIEATDGETLKLVEELTNPSKGSKAPRAVRKQMDRNHLATVSWEAKIIKLIDRTVNLKDMASSPDKKFIALYAFESRQLYEIIKDADEYLAGQLLMAIEVAEELSKK